MSDFVDVLFFRKGYKEPVVICLWLIISFFIITIYYETYIFEPQQKAKDDKEKALIDSSSCPELGKWIIDNAMDNSGKYVSKNYAYAQAKYLVCTHGGTQP